MKKLIAILVFIALVVIYLFPSKSYYFHIPIINQAKDSFVTLEIEGRNIPVVLDLGYSDSLSLQGPILNQFSNKTQSSDLISYDIKGNEYSSPTYIINQVLLGGLSFKNVKTEQETPQFRRNATLGSSPLKTDEQIIQEKPGMIGRKLLQNYNLLLDLKHSRLIAASCLEDLKQDGYPIHRLTPVPFQLRHREGIVLTIQTDLGPKKFTLDTGAADNLLRKTPIDPTQLQAWGPNINAYTTSTFRIGSKDFGPTQLLLVDITSQLAHTDGFLGIQFLRDHLIYLDWKTKTAYIGDSDECYAETQL